MAGETQMHRTLKKEACRWLYRVGYGAVAAEVRLRPLGIIDAVGAGVFGPQQNFHGSKRSVHQTCFVECKQSRGDFLRDQTKDGQLQLCLMERDYNNRRRGGRLMSQTTGLGKFAACLAQPFANLHYILAPAGLVKKTELPARWGLLSIGPGGISVVQRAVWQETANGCAVESAIARTLSADIFRADDRALNSVNREILQQQQALAERIRSLKPHLMDVQQGLFPNAFGTAQAADTVAG